jgi:hypothetical protein
MLLRPGESTGSTSSEVSFTFYGDANKLQSAPNFDATDLSQPSWKHSVYSYFGLSGAGSATGGAESPGSRSSGSSSSDSNNSTNPK